MVIRKKNDDIRRKDPKNKNGFVFSFAHKLIPFSIIYSSMIVSTQKLVKDLNYDENIVGKPWFFFRGEPFYHSWTICKAWLLSAKKLNYAVSDIIYKNSKIVIYGTITGVIIYYFLVYVRNLSFLQDKNVMANGRWMDDKELKNYGLDAQYGVIIGQRYEAEMEVDQSNGLKLTVLKTAPLVAYCTNVCGMLMAGTRMGKGISTVIPTHLSYPTSIMSIDPKGENYSISGGFRKKFSYVYMFSPVTEESLHFNILEDLSERYTYRDSNMVAGILTEPTNPASNADPHWQQTATVLITAAILHCLCSEYKDKSLPGVYKFLTGETVPKGCKDAKKEICRQMIEGYHCRKDIHSSIVSLARQIDTAADEEKGSIFSSALEALSVYNDSIVAEVCRNSDFSIDDFKNTNAPVSWYLCIPFADLKRLCSLCRVIIEFVCKKFSQGLTKFGCEPLHFRMLIIIDEFPTLGKMECIEEFAGILNGYGVSFLWICQSKAQIDKLYGQKAPIMEHARYTWTYAINDDEVAEYFSKRIGNEGIIKQNTSNSGNRHELGMNNMSISNDVTERRLFTANEIETMRGDCELVFVNGGPTYMAKKVAYYSDPRFQNKMNLKVPETRKEMLLETVDSTIHQKVRWFENFEDNDDDDFTYWAENDIPGPVNLQANCEEVSGTEKLEEIV